MAKALTTEESNRLVELTSIDPEVRTKEQQIEIYVLLGFGPVGAAEAVAIESGQSQGDIERL
jgi:hypothetical protein